MSEYYKPLECDWCRIFGKDEAINTKCDHVLACDQCGAFCDACPHDFFLCSSCCMIQCKTLDDGEVEPPRTNPNYKGNIMEESK